MLAAATSCDLGRSPVAAPTTFTTPGPPSEGRLAVYNVVPPRDARNISYWSNEGWHGGLLWVSFETSSTGLDDFLESLNLDRSLFTVGLNPLIGHDSEDVGWDAEFSEMIEFMGYEDPPSATASARSSREPTYDILIDESDPENLVVYVISSLV
jgi:hypothetical protein